MLDAQPELPREAPAQPEVLFEAQGQELDAQGEAAEAAGSSAWKAFVAQRKMPRNVSMRTRTRLTE